MLRYNQTGFLMGFFLVLSTMVFAQQKDRQQKQFSALEVRQMELSAQNYMDQFKYHKSIELYEKLRSAGQLHDMDIYHLAVCYLNQQESKKALKFFEQCLLNEAEYPKTLHFFYARALHYEHQWNKAIEEYQAYGKLFKRSKQTENEIQRYVKQCDRGKRMEAKAFQTQLVALPGEVNTAYPEYGPVLNAEENELYFTANYPQTTGGKKDEFYGVYYEDIYFSKKKERRLMV